MKLKSNIAISQSGFVFNPATGDSFSVNEIAAQILDMLRSGLSAGQIKETIRTGYEVDEDTLERDLDDFLLHLQQLGLAEDEQ